MESEVEISTETLLTDTSSHSWVSLFYSLKQQNMEDAKRVLDEGEDVNEEDNEGNTILHTLLTNSRSVLSIPHIRCRHLQSDKPSFQICEDTLGMFVAPRLLQSIQLGNNRVTGLHVQDNVPLKRMPFFPTGGRVS